MFIDILPNLLGPVPVLATLSIPSAILFEATLSFLGLGVQPPTPSWEHPGRRAELLQRGLVVPGVPALALLITTLAFNLLGDGIRDALDRAPSACSAGPAVAGSGVPSGVSCARKAAPLPRRLPHPPRRRSPPPRLPRRRPLSRRQALRSRRYVAARRGPQVTRRRSPAAGGTGRSHGSPGSPGPCAAGTPCWSSPSGAPCPPGRAVGGHPGHVPALLHPPGDLGRPVHGGQGADRGATAPDHPAARAEPADPLAVLAFPAGCCTATSATPTPPASR